MSSGNHKRLADKLKDLSDSKFWGEATIVYRDGVPTMLRKNETLPLDGRTANANKDAQG